RAVHAYNRAYHTAIKMTPTEGWKCEHNDGNEEAEKRIREQNKRTSAYDKGFKKKCRDQFVRGQILGIKELPEHKENQRFGKTGKIMSELAGDSYIVNCNDRFEKRSYQDLNLLPNTSVNSGLKT
ncbi:hypothetical protein PAEPH01_2801, partial [Pancytospora epiphaga]